MAKERSYSFIKRKFLSFCKNNKVNPEELLGVCEGRVSNFPFWYCDYLKYLRDVRMYRIKTGIYKPIDIYEVW